MDRDRPDGGLMNSVAADFMDPRAKADLTADIRALVRDPDTATAVTLYARGTRTYTPGSGQSTTAETATPLRASVSAAKDAEGAVIPHTVLVQLAADDIAADPAVYERLTWGAESYTILERRSDMLGATHTLIARKAA